MLEDPDRLLRQRGLRPKKSWGQNFLADQSALERIAEAAGLAAGEPVVELGPGLGHLTQYLLATGARVFAVERDRDMVQALEALSQERLTVVEANAAKIDFAKVAGAARVKVVGNLPYHLSSPILFEVLEQQKAVSLAVFTLQKEVVERLGAGPGGRDYGLLSVLLGLYFDVERLFVIPAGAFRPPPKVDSAVVRLVALGQPRAEVSSQAHFKQVVKAAFAQRRKTLLNSLKSDRSLGPTERLMEACQRAKIDPSRRAETLSVVEFAALERALA